MCKKKILIIDDDASQLELLNIFFSGRGYAVHCSATAMAGLEARATFHPDVIVLDIRLPDMDGIEVLRSLDTGKSSINVIMITAYHDMETTVKAMKLGAYEYITKPIDVDELEDAVCRALKNSELREAKELPAVKTFLQKGPMIGNSKPMKEVFKMIGVLSENNVTVLIEGETGTGKELIARAIHDYGPHKDHPFIPINCSAIVGTLLESELFGHEKGAFTGAFATKKGKFELAGEGTIFLDEMGEIPIELQAKLLRFLQDKAFQRVGGEKFLHSKARVIVATNKDLLQMVRAGTFREDLYYRLSAAKINVPPLRKRREDIPFLLDHMVKEINAELGKRIDRVDKKALLRMMEYDWPGNVRELRNVLTGAAISTRGETLLDDAILPFLGAGTVQDIFPPGAALSLREVEREHILKILHYTNGNITSSAQILGISRPTLRQKIRQYKILPQQ
ncbi:sigma-54-dependent transcriptional regulator [Syntrophus aciditrophicus]|uniref:DNA-binding transcriptional regulator NtrC n=1 Tax=Syntrophus aciditrophicus (strain SB) TaxID=56780 RepID=Q2LXW1_SYNAS|nr:sigma-54 dependent transcriptional regulator [Syntrophus aciditrophicus]ABC78924.1 sigma-54 dependent transcription regulator [Syntrophus aciditrophicus SB]